MIFRNTGARVALICCSFLLLLSLFSTNGYAAQKDEPKTVSEEYQNAEKTSQNLSPSQNNSQAEMVNLPGKDVPSGWTLLLQVIFSLGLIIVLIYLLVRFLAKRQIGNFNQNGPIKVISAMPLGNGKSVQVAMIGDSLYILGVGETITLLRHIPAGEEVDLVLADAEIKAATPLLNEWLPFLRRKREQEPLELQQNASGTFDELLEKQWSEINDTEMAAEQWREPHGSRKGEHR